MRFELLMLCSSVSVILPARQIFTTNTSRASFPSVKLMSSSSEVYAAVGYFSLRSLAAISFLSKRDDAVRGEYHVNLRAGVLERHLELNLLLVPVLAGLLRRLHEGDLQDAFFTRPYIAFCILFSGTISSSAQEPAIVTGYR
ncbi:MAG: hypothetical protein ABGY75_03295 [Gemmataceae bacterium]